MKKAFTLVEILICLMIIAGLALMLMQTLSPKRFEKKTNLVSAKKTVETISQAFAQMLDIETVKYSTKSFMAKPAGASGYEYMGNDDVDDSQGIVETLGNYLKYETDVINYCTNTGHCTSDDIFGARLAGGAYFGIEKFDSPEDCPQYRIPGEDTSVTPQVFSARTGTYTTKKCWGKLYIDVQGNKGDNTLGDDVYIFGLGEYGIEK